MYSQYGETLLHKACRNGHEKNAEILVGAGVDLKMKNDVRLGLAVPLALT